MLWITLLWRHNDHDGVSHHQPHGCLLNRWFRRRSKKTSKLRVTGLCVGNSPGPVNSPHKGPVTRKMFPFDDVIMFWSNEVNVTLIGLPQTSPDTTNLTLGASFTYRYQLNKHLMIYCLWYVMRFCINSIKINVFVLFKTFDILFWKCLLIHSFQLETISIFDIYISL